MKWGGGKAFVLEEETRRGEERSVLRSRGMSVNPFGGL